MTFPAVHILPWCHFFMVSCHKRKRKELFQVHSSKDAFNFRHRFSSLTSLDVSLCRLTDDQLAQLAILSRLQALALQGCTQVTDRGLVHLAPLTCLTLLDLQNCCRVSLSSPRALSQEARRSIEELSLTSEAEHNSTVLLHCYSSCTCQGRKLTTVAARNGSDQTQGYITSAKSNRGMTGNGCRNAAFGSK